MQVRSAASLGFCALLLGGQAFAQSGLGGEPAYDASLELPSEPGLATETWPRNDAPSRPAGEVVSVQELEHKVPHKAASEYEQADKARATGNLAGSIRHLETAVKIDPEFVAARNNLAALYLLNQQVGPAVAQLEECIKLDPNDYMPASNLALAYMIERDLPAAERTARRGVELDHTGTRSRLILAMALLMQDKFTPEALGLLKRAEQDFPQAQLLSARIYAAHGEFDEARAAINGYLASGQQDGRPLAKQWLKLIDRTERQYTAGVRTVH
jgi:tetratricopeptide (TPR) repeat protein